MKNFVYLFMSPNSLVNYFCWVSSSCCLYYPPAHIFPFSVTLSTSSQSPRYFATDGGSMAVCCNCPNSAFKEESKPFFFSIPCSPLKIFSEPNGMSHEGIQCYPISMRKTVFRRAIRSGKAAFNSPPVCCYSTPNCFPSGFSCHEFC